MDKKNKTPIYAVYKRPTSNLGTHTDWKWRAGKKIFHVNGDSKKAGAAILISDKIDFEIKAMKRDREGHYIRINPRRYNNYKYICTQHRSTAICNAMLTNMKGEINSNTIIVGDFNTPLTSMDRSTKQKISKETQTLNDTMDLLIDIYRTFHPKTTNFTFFLSAHGTFSRIDHILGHESSLGKLKKKKKKNWNHLKHLFWSQCINYRKKKNYEKYKHMECKQHTPE